MKQDHNTLQIPLPVLDFRTGHRDGLVLRKCNNVRPVGRKDNPFLSPVAAPGSVRSFTDLLSIHRQRRQRHGEWSTDVEGADPSSLDRLVGIAHYPNEPLRYDEVLIIDPALGHTSRPAGGLSIDGRRAFARDDITRKTVSSQIGPELFLASATGELPDKVEPIISIRDDQVLPLVLPGVPKVKVSWTGVEPADQLESGSLKSGIYALRYAWILEDGSIGLPTGARMISLPALYPNSGIENWRFRLKFEVDSGDVAYLQDFWAGLLRGIVVAISERDRSLDPLLADEEEDPEVAKRSSLSSILNFPFYLVTEIPTNANDEGGFTANVLNWKGEWSDDDEKIPTYLTMEDDRITVGGGGTCIAYNRRLFVGDVAVDWPIKPLTDQLLNPGDHILGDVSPRITTSGGLNSDLDVEHTFSFNIVMAEGLSIQSIGLSIEPSGTRNDWTVQFKYLSGYSIYNNTGQLSNYAEGTIAAHPMQTHTSGNPSRAWIVEIITTQSQVVSLLMKITATNSIGNPTTLEKTLLFA